MKKLGLVGLLLCGAVGCGGGSGDPGGTGGGGGIVRPQPTDHIVDDTGDVRDVQAGQRFILGPFQVPAGATVTYILSDMPVGFGADSMNAGVVSDAESQATNPTAWGEVAGASSTQQITPALAAGTYDLLVKCANVIDDCFFTDTITAYY